MRRRGAATNAALPARPHSGRVSDQSPARRCSERGYTGLACMAGIPGTVGGAVRMNAGGRDGEFGQIVRQVTVLESDGTIEVWEHGRIGFGYRCTGLGDRIVLSALLELGEDDPRRVKRMFEEYLDNKRRGQPLAENSAGCIFKNPDGQSAGALIDKAGLKGSRCGGACISKRHANFIVTEHGAKTADVLRLIDRIRDRVRCEYGIELEIEIDIW